MTQGFSNAGTGGSLKPNILNSLNRALKTALFMEAIRNLNWSYFILRIKLKIIYFI